MLSAEEHPGVFTFLVGIIVLVMAGVGLSLVIDRRLEFSSGVIKIQNEINLDAVELEHLTAWHDERSRLLNESGLRLKTGLVTNEGISGKLKALHQRQVFLEETRGRLRNTITSLEEDFSRCRAEYRRKTWAAAVGEKLGHLKIRGGREYEQVTISRVTDVGLEIRHEAGIARIQAPDLDSTFQARFQWSDEERGKTLKDEQENLDGQADDPGVDHQAGVQAASAPAVRESGRLQKSKSAAGNEELDELRRLVSGWQAKVNQLSRDRQEAASRAGYGAQSSVPGSLETWSARAGRLANALAGAQVELAVAKSRLAALAPNDPLLRPLVGGL